MNKKFKIFMLTLLLVSSTTINSNYAAAGLNSNDGGIFTSIGDYFGHLFGGDQVEAYENSILKGGEFVPAPEEAPEVTDSQAKNTAYGKNQDDKEDQGTGIIDLDGNIQGLVIEKDLSSPDGTTCSDGTGDVECIEAKDDVQVDLHVTNTGLKTETVTVKDPLDSFPILYNPAADVTFTAVTDSSDPMAVLSTTPLTVGQLVTDGIQVENVDSGDDFTLTFTVSDGTLNPDVADDYIMHNIATVCTKYTGDTSDYGTIHTTDGSRDGVIISNGTDYSLCNLGADDILVDANGGGITLPEIEGLVPFKVVTDSDADYVAEPGDTLNYTIGLVYVGDSKTITVTDPLNNASMTDNVDFNDADEVEIVTNRTDLTTDPDPVTIADLKTGVDITIPGAGYALLNFSGTVKTDINYDNLVDSGIENTATITDGGKDVEIDVNIPVDHISSTLDLEKSIDANKDGEYSSFGEIVDGDELGYLTSGDFITTAPTTTPTIDYRIELSNTSGKDVRVTLSDNKPDQTYLDFSDPASIVVTANSKLGAFPETTGTFADLTAGISGTVKAGDIITIDFGITLTGAFYQSVVDAATASTVTIESIAELVLPESPLFTNKAIISYKPKPLGDPETLTDGVWGSLDGDNATGADGVDLTKEMVEPEDTTSIAAGTPVTYQISLNNTTDNTEIYGLYDTVNLENSFVNDKNDTSYLATIPLELEGTGVKFVTSYTDTAEVTDLTLADLADPAPKVFLMVPSNTEAKISFTIETDKDPESTDLSWNPANKLVNGIGACYDETGLDTVGLYTGSNCSIETDIKDMGTESGLKIEKKSSQPGGDNPDIAEPSEMINYEITVENVSTSKETVDYNIIDNMNDDNIVDDFDIAMVSIDLDSNTAPGEDQQMTFREFKNLGYARSGLEFGNIDTYTFTLQVANDGTDHLIDPSKQYLENQACAKITDSKEPVRSIKPETRSTDDEFCDLDQIPTDPDPIDNTPGVDVKKSMMESKDPALANGDGVIAPGETITVSFVVYNISKPMEDVIVNIKENLTDYDHNIDWTSSIGNELSIFSLDDNASFVTSYTDEADPTPLTVGDLVDTSGATPTATEGIYVKTTSDVEAIVSFDLVTQLNENWTWTAADKITNEIEYCQDETSCTDDKAIIETVGFEDLTISKKVIDSVDADGAPAVDTSTPPNFIAKDGGTLTYEVVVENTGSIDFAKGDGHNLKIQDLFDTEFTQFYSDAAADVLVDIHEYTTYIDYGDTGNVKDDSSSEITYSGITMEDINTTPVTGTFEAGNSLVLDFDINLAEDLSFLDLNEETVPNTASVCFVSKGLSAMPGVTNGKNICYSASVETPYGDGTGEVEVGDGTFGITKTILDADESHELNAGEDITMNIDVTNMDPEDTEVTQEITITDKFLDDNFAYDLSTKIEVYDITGDASGTDGPFSTVNYGYTAVETGVAEGESTSVTLENMLPDATDTEAAAKWPEADYPNRGGVILEIPANHTYRIVVNTQAQGTASTATRIKEFFDVKKFFV